jgi:hypothetical protein
VEQVLPWEEGSWHQWEGGVGKEKDRRMNMVQAMYTHTHIYINAKTRNCSRNEGRGDEGEQWRGEFNYDIFDTL